MCPADLGHRGPAEPTLGGFRDEKWVIGSLML